MFEGSDDAGKERSDVAAQHHPSSRTPSPASLASLRPFLIVALSLALVAAILVVEGRPATGQAVPASGGIYVEGVVGHPTYLNPLLSTFNDADDDVAALVFSGLTRLANDGSVQPDLAASWTVSPDGKVYTFRLKDAAWSDGAPVTADDVVYTIGQIQAPGFPGSPDLARAWASVKVARIDAKTVRFTLAAPYAPFPELTTQGLLPSHLLKGTTGRGLLTTPFNARPVGTGPFEVQSASLGQIVLVPNPRYLGPAPNLAGITFTYYDSYPSAQDALNQGEIEGLGNLPPDQVLSLSNDSRRSVLQATEDARMTLLFLNLDEPLFADDLARQALDRSIDRAAVIQAALNGEGVPAAGPISPASWAYAAQGSAYTHDPAQAAQLLDQAGWTLSAASGLREKNGKPFRFVLLTPNQPDRIKAAQEISRQLRLVGIEADVQTAAWSAIVQNFLAPRHFDAVLAETYAPSADPDPYPFWDSSQIKNGFNVAGWSNRVADQLLEDARQRDDQSGRRVDYARFQALFAQQQPSILLYYPLYSYAIPAALHGVNLGLILQPSDRFRTVSSWYLRTELAASR